MPSSLLKPFIKDTLDREFPLPQDNDFRLGSFLDPELFQVDTETFNSTSTIFQFQKQNGQPSKRRRTTLTANLTACVIRCPEKSGLIQVEFAQDSTGSRTIPTITAVASDGTTAVTIVNIGAAQFTATTTASRVDCITYRYDQGSALLKEVRRNLNYVAANA